MDGRFSKDWQKGILVAMDVHGVILEYGLSTQVVSYGSSGCSHAVLDEPNTEWS
jgi:hypothetical protein